MIRVMLTILLVLGLASVANAKSTGEHVTTFALENGMQVVVVEDHRAPVVQQMVWYKVGARDETLGKSGAAHFLEHLMFKATGKMKSGELSATVAANGGRDNAFTSYDFTAYFQRVAADRLGLMMRMEADRMVNLHLTQQDIETERQVILEERNQRIDTNPRALFSEQMNAAQYANEHYGIPVIGWRQEMENLDLGDEMGFYKRHYAPNNAILVVSGDVYPQAVRKLAETYFGVIPANPDLAARPRISEPPQIAARRLTVKDKRVAQQFVSLSYLTSGRQSGDQQTAAALDILAEILGGGTTSYLTEKLQFEKQIAVYTGASYSSVSLGHTTFSITVAPSEGVSLADAEAALAETMTAFMEQGVDPDQLARIKMQLRASQIYARDNVKGIANRYGQALASGLSVQDVQAWPDVLQSVTADQIMAAAKSVLRPEASVTGWLMRDEEVAQ